MNTLTPICHNNTVFNNCTINNRVSFRGNDQVDRVELSTEKEGMKKSEKMLLSLLKSGLSGEAPEEKVFANATISDWQKVVEMSDKSATTAILYDGIKSMKKTSVPAETLIELEAFKNHTEKEYAKRLQIISELTDKFNAKGVDTIHLKGVGASMNYPVPNHRYGCDIDIFTRLKGKETTDLSNAYNIADDVMISEGLEVGSYNNKYAKHSEFNYRGVEVDNHKYFIAKKQFPYAKELDMYLHKNLNPVEKILPNGKKVLVPSKEFNSVFISHHAFQHHIINELNLHHLIDWGMHVKQNGLQIPEEAKGTKFEEFTYAITNLSNRYLGTNVKVPENKEYEDKLMREILHPKGCKEETEQMNKLELLIHKTKRCFRNAQRIHDLGGNSTFETFGKAALNKFLHPTTLFVR